tara:strand:+ start:7156 stop:7920 length:765 start_codon:yes stop_codon:yes gene_type:complete
MDYELIKMGEGEYFKHPALNRSKAWSLYNKTPAHSRIETKTTPAMERGKAAHAVILEPIEFERNYGRGPDVSKNTKEWKAAAAASNKTLLKPDEFEDLMGITNAVKNHTTASNLLHGNNVDKEVTCLWHDPYTGLDLKARYDAINHDAKVIVDVKTTTDASINSFSRSMANFGYHFQDAWYTDPLDSEWRFIFICVESSPPYSTAIYELDEEGKRVGRSAMVEALEVYASCIKEDSWHAYPQEVQPISLPHWYR